MASCTIFKNFTVPVENKSLIVISKDIASGKYKTEVEEIQLLIAEGKEEEAKVRKQKLLAFTPSATFREQRLLPNMEQYSGFIHLDFDKLTPEQLIEAFKIICSIPYTFLCFRSPSGNGLKVFVEVNTGAEQHDIAYKQVQQFYEEKLGIASDPKCKDITRLCFMSHDPALYKNLNCEKFEIKLSSVPPPPIPPVELPQQQPEENDWTEALLECLRFTEQKKTYSEGNRNEFIYVFASNANRKGIPQDIALQFCLQKYDLPEKEIRSSFRSAYTHHTSEFAKFANSAKLQDHPFEDFLKQTPLVPDELYSKMPDIIRNGAAAFSQLRERDVFLTGALPILSGCLPGVKGVYDGQEVFPNLYSFAVAPAASGKGALKFAKMLADVYHQSVVQSSKDAETQYKTELSEHKAREKAKSKKDTSVEEAPEQPAFKVIFIPANTSYAKILSHLEQNEGFGIICETEADTMGNVFKQDWGGYSDMLRKAFHHERISSSRKTNNEFIEVNDPRLSVALTGTPGQVTGLIVSSEDGLFSRFLFYAFKVEQNWKDVSPSANRVNLTEHFKSLSRQVFEMVQFLQREETTIELTAEQWQELNSTCEAWLHDVTMFTAEEAASIVKRLGLVLYRIAMLFTAMRKFENAEVANQMVCTDEDFSTALRLAEIYLQHAILMFNNLPKQSEETHFKGSDNKRKFFAALPDEFTRQQAVTLGAQYQMSPRSVDGLLSSLIGKHLSQPKTGHYKKN
jgi:hypothetical protein